MEGWQAIFLYEMYIDKNRVRPLDETDRESEAPQHLLTCIEAINRKCL